MTSLREIQTAASRLTDSERARLATSLLRSLPGVLEDDDAGVAEASRRDAEMTSGKVIGISMKELKRGLGR